MRSENWSTRGMAHFPIKKQKCEDKDKEDLSASPTSGRKRKATAIWGLNMTTKAPLNASPHTLEGSEAKEKERTKPKRMQQD